MILTRSVPLFTYLYSVFDDPRMFDVMGVALGIDLQATTRPEGSDELPPGVSQSTTSPKPSSSSKPPPAPEPPVEEDVEMSEEDTEEAKAKKESEEAKKAGGEAYKQKKFDEAAALYQKAWDLWPKDVTYLTNLGGELIQHFHCVFQLTSRGPSCLL